MLYRFRLAGPAEKVGMATGATIHTANGLLCTVERRIKPVVPPVTVTPEGMIREPVAV